MSTSRRSELALSPAGGSGNGTLMARVLGSGCAGVCELLVFHPVDTVAKRLMSNTVSLEAAGGLNAVIFREAAQASAFQRWASLFPGLGYGAGYKILQRVYKFGGQPFVKEGMKRNYGDTFTSVFGKKTGATMISALSGSIMGVGEIALLPLDVLKIKAQTNPESLAGRGIVDVLRSEGLGLYRGWGWTAARNAPGSFSLFGGAAFAKQLMGVADGHATVLQDTIASVAGSIASITVAAPLDVIKTRLQSGQVAGNVGGFSVIASLVKEEGFSAFFKGLTPKIVVVGPKLIFSFTIAQQLMQHFERVL